MTDRSRVMWMLVIGTGLRECCICGIQQIASLDAGMRYRCRAWQCRHGDTLNTSGEARG